MKSKMSKILMLLLVSILVLAACSSEESGNAESAEQGNKEIVYATTSEPLGLSPVGTFDGSSNRAIVQIYERLFMLNPESGEIEPHLAESYENPDDKTWVIQLKEGIKFHDGSDFNAEAVKYTFEKFIDPATASPAAHTLSAIESIETEGDSTVIIKTADPAPTLINTLAAANSSIISPTADQKQDLMQQPVGTGPFKFVAWEPGANITLEKNGEYWKGDLAIDKLTFKVVPEMSTALSMLQTGDVQLVDGMNAQHLKRAEGIESVEILKEQGTYVTFLSVNHDRAPMNELPFRQALAYGIDLENFRSQLGGTGYESDGMIGPTIVGYDPIIEESGYQYDVEKAKQLVKENGYDQQELTFLATTQGEYMKYTEILQAQLADIGLKVKIETMDWGTYLEATVNGEFDLYVLGTTNASAGADNLYNNMHSKNIGSSNRMRYNNPEFDRLIVDAKKEFDESKRQELLNTAHQKIIEEANVIPLHHGYVLLAHDKQISGIKVYPDGMWYLTEATIQ